MPSRLCRHKGVLIGRRQRAPICQAYESWSHRLLVPVHAQPAVANTHSQLDPHKTADLQNSASPSIRTCKRSVMLSCELLQPGLIISLRDV